MGAYRLEVWFNYPQGTIDWGIAQAAAGGNPPFSNGGTALPKNSDGVVTITGAGRNSTFDIYLFDVSGDQVARTLQSIQIDYEKAGGAGPGQGRNPIGDAAGLRNGLTGAQFSGQAGGYTSGVGQEETIFSAPAGTPAAQRRWSLIAGYEGLTPGRYSFTASTVVAEGNSNKTLGFDPEMDIGN
jgi:hypothetical protein